MYILTLHRTYLTIWWSLNSLLSRQTLPHGTKCSPRDQHGTCITIVIYTVQLTVVYLQHFQRYRHWCCNPIYSNFRDISTDAVHGISLLIKSQYGLPIPTAFLWLMLLWYDIKCTKVSVCKHYKCFINATCGWHMWNSLCIVMTSARSCKHIPNKHIKK